jgi:hypothetical protein
MKNTINAEFTKKVNQQKILHLIREKNCSRIEIANITGLTRAAISLICDNLLKEGLIIETQEKKSQGGRPKIALEINKNYGLLGAISFSREEYHIGIADFSGRSIHEETGLMDKNNPDVTLEKMVTFFSKNLNKDQKLLGIGICAPGPLDKKAGKLLDLANLNKWSNLNICKYFENHLKCRTVLDNFSNALALAECIINENCQTKYLALVIDSGFGSAVIAQDSLSMLSECELGHITVNMYGEKCDCGNKGCSELYVNEHKYNGTPKERKEFFEALSSTIITAYNIYKTNQVFIFETFNEDFVIFKKELKKYLKKKSNINFDIQKSVLENEYIFTSVNLLFLND